MDKSELTMNENGVEVDERGCPVYCEDFCPIYWAIQDYNSDYRHRHGIFCNTEFCSHVQDVYLLNKAEATKNND